MTFAKIVPQLPAESWVFYPYATIGAGDVRGDRPTDEAARKEKSVKDVSA